MENKLLWAVVLTLVYFFILPFPLSFIACIITGAILPWIGDTKNKNNKKDVDR